MSYDHKISDLKYRINGLVPKDVCKKIINIFEKHPKKFDQGYGFESSLKFKTLKIEEDNFECLNLSLIKNPTEEITLALNEAKKYIAIMIANYVLHIKTKKICQLNSQEYQCHLRPFIRLCHRLMTLKLHIRHTIYWL